MNATEFQTVIDDPYIKIPDYENFKGRRVRIIVIGVDKRESADDRDGDFIDYMVSHPVDLKDATKFLSREEANER